MTQIDQGTLGAKRATWRDTNPRKLLRQLVEKDGEAGDWSEEMWDTIKNDVSDIGILRAIFQYWYDNNIRSLVPELMGRRRTEQVARTAQQVEAGAAQFRKLILLSLVMPNGKPLGDCTGAECRSFEGWLSQLATLVPPNQKVADVLTEEKLQELWNRTLQEL